MGRTKKVALSKMFLYISISKCLLNNELSVEIVIKVLI